MSVALEGVCLGSEAGGLVLSLYTEQAISTRSIALIMLKMHIDKHHHVYTSRMAKLVIALCWCCLRVSPRLPRATPVTSSRRARACLARFCIQHSFLPQLHLAFTLNRFAFQTLKRQPCRHGAYYVSAWIHHIKFITDTPQKLRWQEN